MNLAKATRNPGRRRAPLLVRLVIVLVALTHGWGSCASAVSFSHDPAFWAERAGAAAESRSPDHDHGHGESPPDGEEPELQGGHDAADHSHDKPALGRNAAHFAASPTNDWNSACPAAPYPSPLFAFDRPPRHLSLH
jgi:hypothetical protein